MQHLCLAVRHTYAVVCHVGETLRHASAAVLINSLLQLLQGTLPTLNTALQGCKDCNCRWYISTHLLTLVHDTAVLHDCGHAGSDCHQTITHLLCWPPCSCWKSRCHTLHAGSSCATAVMPAPMPPATSCQWSAHQTTSPLAALGPAQAATSFRSRARDAPCIPTIRNSGCRSRCSAWSPAVYRPALLLQCRMS